MQECKNISIIDTHFHIWERKYVALDWIKNTMLDRDFNLQDYLDSYQGINLMGGIYIEVDSVNKKQEFEYIQNLVRQKTKILGFCLNPNLLNNENILNSHKLCGMRQVLHTPDSPKIDSKEFVQTLEKIATNYKHLVFEACVAMQDLLKLAHVAKIFPNIKIVLNHFGNPPFNQDLNSYAKNFSELSLCDNVYCKLSPSDHFMPLSESNMKFYQNLFTITLNSFNTNQLLFGSNYPVSKITPKQWIEIVYKNLSGLDSESIENIFKNNAYQCYNIMPPIQRFGQIIGIKKEKLQDYKILHDNAWSGVLKTLKKAHIQNYSIYHYKDFLFAYFEYTGDNFQKDMEQIAQDPITQEWWKHTDICQIPMPEMQNGQMWTNMEEVFHLD